MAIKKCKNNSERRMAPRRRSSSVRVNLSCQKEPNNKRFSLQNRSQKDSELKPTELIFQEKLDELDLEVYHFPLTIRERKDLAEEKDYDQGSAFTAVHGTLGSTESFYP